MKFLRPNSVLIKSCHWSTLNWVLQNIDDLNSHSLPNALKAFNCLNVHELCEVIFFAQKYQMKNNSSNSTANCMFKCVTRCMSSQSDRLCIQQFTVSFSFCMNTLIGYNGVQNRYWIVNIEHMFSNQLQPVLPRESKQVTSITFV